MIEVLKYLKGYLRIRVWGFSPERFMNLCSNKNILLWKIEQEGEVFYMNISLAGFYQLKEIARKTGTRVAICKRYGLPFLIPSLLARKVFIMGLFLAVSFWIWSSFYIWDIELNGNYQISQDVFTTFLKQEEIAIGMPKKNLDIETLEKEIRKKFPKIIWTSAKLDGTKLQIDIKENDAPIITEIKEESAPKDLAAEYEGVIVSMIVRKGVPKVSIGDTVQKGDVLVEGKIPIFNEDGTVRAYQYAAADADIILEYTKKFRTSLSFDYVKKEYTGREKKHYFLRFGEQEIKLPQDRPFLIYDSLTKTSRPLIFEKLSIPVYLGNTLLDEVIVDAQNRQNLRSGGR